MIDRDALIEAADRAVGRAFLDADEQLSARVLDAVLPLIADAIEVQGREAVHFYERVATGGPAEAVACLIAADRAYKHAIRLVRSLLGMDSDQ